MFNGLFAANVCIAAALVLIDLFVISKNSKAKINRIFFVAVLFISAWIMANYLSNDQNLSSTTVLAANHLVLFFSSLVVFYLARFVALLGGFTFFERHNFILSSINYLVAFLTLTPLIISDVSKQESVYAITFGKFAFLYFLLLMLNALAIVYSLYRGLRKTRGLERNRIQTVFWGLVATLCVVLITNAFIPLVTGSFSLTNIGPLASIIFVSTVAYSIVRHRLFDIRAVVARSVTYILLLATLSAVFAISVLGVTSLFFSDSHISTGAKASFVTISLLMAFALQPLKRFFDKVTNRLFYRDAYEPQELLNNLNNSLVTKIDLLELLSMAAKIISGTLKAEYGTFLINQKKDHKPFQSIGTKQLFTDAEEVKKLISYTHHGRRTILADELSGVNSELKKMLNSHDVSAVVKLEGKTNGIKENVGFLLLGQKRSGNIYSFEDTRVLEIIADELVIAIQNSLRFEEIKEFNITLQQKIEDATRQLRHANHKLKELDATKDEFISMASHQLRTPLTTIKGYLSMVLEGDVGPVRKNEREMIQKAFDGAEKMVFLIGDLLNISRLQSGKFVIENTPTDLAKMVEAEVSQLQATAENHKLKMTFAKPANFPMLNLDGTKIRQVIMNFMDNAIYYTPSGGSIEVKLEATDKTVNYTVTDTGLGVPKAEQHHLFSKFYRAGNARKMRPDGTGLGLFMAKKVIVAQGGSIIFSSTEGKGSTFGFSFPRTSVEIKK